MSNNPIRGLFYKGLSDEVLEVELDADDCTLDAQLSHPSAATALLWKQEFYRTHGAGVVPSWHWLDVFHEDKGVILKSFEPLQELGSFLEKVPRYRMLFNAVPDFGDEIDRDGYLEGMPMHSWGWDSCRTRLDELLHSRIDWDIAGSPFLHDCLLYSLQLHSRIDWDNRLEFLRYLELVSKGPGPTAAGLGLRFRIPIRNRIRDWFLKNPDPEILIAAFWTLSRTGDFWLILAEMRRANGSCALLNDRDLMLYLARSGGSRGGSVAGGGNCRTGETVLSGPGEVVLACAGLTLGKDREFLRALGREE